MADVKIYVTDYCPYCVRAKGLLNRKKIPFTEINVDGDDAKRAWLVSATKQRTVPQIFIDDRSIGGCDDLHALDRSVQLDKLLGRA